jgi:hypothetical protein
LTQTGTLRWNITGAPPIVKVSGRASGDTLAEERFKVSGNFFFEIGRSRKDFLKSPGWYLRRGMMTRCATIVLYSAVVGLFLSTICLGQAPTSGPQTVFGLFNDLQIARINELIDTKLNTLSTSQTAAVNDLIDTKLKTLSTSQTAALNELIDTKLKTSSTSQTAAVNELIDTKLKTSSASQTAAVNDLIDTKLKTLSASQTAKLNELMTKIVNDTQAAKLSEMIDIKLKTWSDSQSREKLILLPPSRSQR